MPTHDVNDAFDPSFIDTFTVLRRAQTVNQVGRVQITEQQIAGQGVVVASSPNDLLRVPEMQYQNKSISIYTTMRLQGPSAGMQPDEILWHGSQYVVRALDDYSGYGRGWIMVICTSIDAVDPPPTFPNTLGTA